MHTVFGKGLRSLHCGVAPRNLDMAGKEPSCLTRKNIRQVSSIVYLQQDELGIIAKGQSLITYLEI